jgi:selenocysteine-specific elongation factor
MNRAIIGTAGHVDHGKTLLIKALTGHDTDRLIEEKKRGITIELGFASLALPDGGRAGIIDVPGHEKFIKNMLAGAGSIDLALLVIAADEGVMPQTREHLDILTLLGIKRGVVALTKADRVEPDWLELVRMDIGQELEGTFLENAPVLPVSSVTGEGIEALRQQIFDLLVQSPPKMAKTPFRLPVDRVFTVDGFGTVVTGTLIEGTMKVGETATVFPSMKHVKVRTLQVHDEAVASAYAGQRVAVNLAGLAHGDVLRGAALAAQQSMVNSTALDVRVDALTGCVRELRNGSRLHLYHGTRDMLCRINMPDRPVLKKGERAYARLRLSEPLAAKPGDRFVLRFYSPLETVGGGVILDPNPPRQYDAASIAALDTGTLRDRIAQMVFRHSAAFPDAHDFCFRLFGGDPAFREAAEALLADGELVGVSGERMVHTRYLDSVAARCRTLLTVYHTENPLHKGMRRDELWKRLLPQTDTALADKVIDLLIRRGSIKGADGRVGNPGFEGTMGERHRQIGDVILKTLLDAGYAPPSYDETAQPYEREKKVFKQTFDALAGEGRIILLAPSAIIHAVHYDNALAVFKELAGKQAEVTLAEFRDALGTSRKYAVALLEHFDRKGITKKTGDARKLA